MITDDASHASVACKVVDMETANEGKDADVFAFCLPFLFEIYVHVHMCVCVRARMHTHTHTCIWWNDNRFSSLPSHVQFYFSLSLFTVVCE